MAGGSHPRLLLPRWPAPRSRVTWGGRPVWPPGPAAFRNKGLVRQRAGGWAPDLALRHM